MITDLDSIGETGTAKVLPERNKNYRTGNTTLRDWVPGKESLEELLDLPDNAKQTEDGLVGVAYQCPIRLTYKSDSDEEEAIPYTFEDSLAFTNLTLFRDYKNPKGLLKKLTEGIRKDTLLEASKEMFKSLLTGSKAEMALELFYLTDPSKLTPPAYISEGLKWLEEKIAEKNPDNLATTRMAASND